MFMLFKVISNNRYIPPSDPKNQFYLIFDSWDDWFTYNTMFSLAYVDSNGETHYIGRLKIGEFGLKKGRPSIPGSFDQLSDHFFSLGQDVTYYENINKSS